MHTIIDGSRVKWEHGIVSHPVNGNLNMPIIIEGRMPKPSEWFAILQDVFAKTQHSYSEAYVKVIELKDFEANNTNFPKPGDVGMALVYTDGVAVMLYNNRFWWLLPNQWELTCQED